MSDLPMTVPAGAEGFAHAELVLSLPPEWPIAGVGAATTSSDSERWYWPIRWMKTLARMPHEYRTWLGMGHTVPNGDPPEPFAPDTKLCGWLLLPPVSLPSEAWSVEASDGRKIRLYSIVALHAEEMNLKLNRGTDALIDAFERANVGEVLSPARPSAVRKKLFDIF